MEHDMNLFDICIITAADDRQAEIFRTLIRRRVDAHLYPREIAFLVYADPPGGRIGSGGGTVWALYSLLRNLQPKNPPEFFKSHKILILHAGGESRRLPCYAPEGKLFAPVPVGSSSVIPPVVLDLQLRLFLDYPWNDGEVLVGSGDVILDFDTTLVPSERGDVCGFAKAATVEQGSRHGVFVLDRYEHTALEYYQKQSPDFLLENAAFEGTSECALDIGLVSMSPSFVETLLSLLENPSDDEGTPLGDELRDGKSPFDLYREILISTLPDLTLEEYKGRIASRSSLSILELETVFGKLSTYDLGCVLTHKSSFLHFGSLQEFPEACLAINRQDLRPFYRAAIRQEIGAQCTEQIISYNSSNVQINSNSRLFIENCSDMEIHRTQDTLLCVGINNLQMSAEMPAGICMDGRLVDNQMTIAVYSVCDTFKPCASIEEMRFCGMPMTDWLNERNLTQADIFSDPKDADLYDARLFAAVSGVRFVEGYWRRPMNAEQWRRRFLNTDRYTLKELNRISDAAQRDEDRIRSRRAELKNQILGGVGWHSVNSAEFSELFTDHDIAELAELYDSTDDPLLKQYRHRSFSALETSIQNSFEQPKKERIIFYSHASSETAPTVSVKKDQIVWARCPVRFDLGGGWTDTPPYTNRFGGQVVNIAANLNDQPPIQVFIRPTQERWVRVHSIDLGVTETYTKTAELLDYQDPQSAFSLPKAAISLTGLIGAEAKSLEALLKEMGAGLEMTLLCAVPKGSGLGTSSILGAVILAALHRFFGLVFSRDELILQVLEMEQMLTTGGGWQDQIGGIAGGVKYIEALPGLKPDPVISQLDTFLFEDDDYRDRYTLFYTGITRLAKNILQEIVDEVNAASPAYLFTLGHLKELAQKARRAIGHRDFAALARVLQSSWEANKLMHPSTTNEEVEGLLEETRPYYRGMKLLGAGGGGYALFASESVEEADRLKELLARKFENARARIVDFSLNNRGLRVTVS